MRALLSVADRSGLPDLARDLVARGVELVATDGTREALTAEGSRPARRRPDGHAALAGGQVKTYHPAVYAGILARRDRPEQLTELAEQGIGHVRHRGRQRAALRAAGRRPHRAHRRGHRDDRRRRAGPPVGGGAELRRRGGGLRPRAVRRRSSKSSARSATCRRSCDSGWPPRPCDVAAYDAEVAAYLNHIAGTRFPDRLTLVLEKQSDLPYGENPHQRGAFYRETTHRAGTLADAARLQGATPTFNDLLDLDAAYRITADFTAPRAIVKRANPVGLASATACRGLPNGARGRPGQRVRRDRGVNRTSTRRRPAPSSATPTRPSSPPAIDEEARASSPEGGAGRPDHPATPDGRHLRLRHRRPRYRRIGGGLLVQTRDRGCDQRAELRVVTAAGPPSRS